MIHAGRNSVGWSEFATSGFLSQEDIEDRSCVCILHAQLLSSHRCVKLTMVLGNQEIKAAITDKST